MQKKVEVHTNINMKNIEDLNQIINEGIKKADLVCENIKDYDIDSIISSCLDKLDNSKTLDTQAIDLSETNFCLPHLDIGGGGESIIYRASEENITIIDLDFDNYKYSNRATIINMDARKLDFTDKSFNSVSIFYTLMYINDNDILKVLKEAYRVLNKDGLIYIWDINIKNNDSDFIVAPIKVHGRKFNKNVTFASNEITLIRDSLYYLKALKKSGFDNVEIKETNNSIFLIAKK